MGSVCCSSSVCPIRLSWWTLEKLVVMVTLGGFGEGTVVARRHMSAAESRRVELLSSSVSEFPVLWLLSVSVVSTGFTKTVENRSCGI